MQSTGHFRGLKVAIGLALVLCVPFAGAHNRPRVDWSINIGTPYAAPFYNPPTVVYSQPEIIYTQPEVIYARPQPVYIERAPVMQYRPYYPRARYTEEVYYRKPGHHRHHGHHRYYRD